MCFFLTSGGADSGVFFLSSLWEMHVFSSVSCKHLRWLPEVFVVVVEIVLSEKSTEAHLFMSKLVFIFWKSKKDSFQLNSICDNHTFFPPIVPLLYTWLARP